MGLERRRRGLEWAGPARSGTKREDKSQRGATPLWPSLKTAGSRSQEPVCLASTSALSEVEIPADVPPPLNDSLQILLRPAQLQRLPDPLEARIDQLGQRRDRGVEGPQDRSRGAEAVRLAPLEVREVGRDGLFEGEAVDAYMESQSQYRLSADRMAPPVYCPRPASNKKSSTARNPTDSPQAIQNHHLAFILSLGDFSVLLCLFVLFEARLRSDNVREEGGEPVSGSGGGERSARYKGGAKQREGGQSSNLSSAHLTPGCHFSIGNRGEARLD